MDEFLKHLIKKSDKSKNEFFNYNHIEKENKTYDLSYNKTNKVITDNYVVFDIETTGLNAIKDKIIEIAAVKVINNKISDKFNELINPNQIIPPFIEYKIGITNQMVEDCKTIEYILPKFIKFIESNVLVAHNAKFDMSFIKKNCIDYNIKFDNKVIDTLSLSKKYINSKKYTLSHLSQLLEIEHKNAHRAYYDVLATYELYNIIILKHNNKQV